jgi:hypothetical protein
LEFWFEKKPSGNPASGIQKVGINLMFDGLLLMRRTPFLIWLANPFWTNPNDQGCQIAYFQAKNPNLGKILRVLGSCNGSCCYILCPFGLFYGNLVYFVAISYILGLFGNFFPVLVHCTKKDLATLLMTRG